MKWVFIHLVERHFSTFSSITKSWVLNSPCWFLIHCNRSFWRCNSCIEYCPSHSNSTTLHTCMFTNLTSFNCKYFVFLKNTHYIYVSLPLPSFQKKLDTIHLNFILIKHIVYSFFVSQIVSWHKHNRGVVRISSGETLISF